MQVQDDHEALTGEHVDIASESVDVILSRVFRLDPVYAEPAVFVHCDTDGVGLPSFEAVD